MSFGIAAGDKFARTRASGTSRWSSAVTPGRRSRDLPECFAGWMGRTAVQSGEIFDARTVPDKIDIAGETTVNIPLLIDLKERQVIWSDIAPRVRFCPPAASKASLYFRSPRVEGRYVATAVSAASRPACRSASVGNTQSSG